MEPRGITAHHPKAIGGTRAPEMTKCEPFWMDVPPWARGAGDDDTGFDIDSIFVIPSRSTFLLAWRLIFSSTPICSDDVSY